MKDLREKSQSPIPPGMEYVAVGALSIAAITGGLALKDSRVLPFQSHETPVVTLSSHTVFPNSEMFSRLSPEIAASINNPDVRGLSPDSIVVEQISPVRGRWVVRAQGNNIRELPILDPGNIKGVANQGEEVEISSLLRLRATLKAIIHTWVWGKTQRSTSTTYIATMKQDKALVTLIEEPGVSKVKRLYP